MTDFKDIYTSEEIEAMCAFVVSPAQVEAGAKTGTK